MLEQQLAEPDQFAQGLANLPPSVRLQEVTNSVQPSQLSQASSETSQAVAVKKLGRRTNKVKFEEEKAKMVAQGHDPNDPQLESIICKKLKINPKTLTYVTKSVTKTMTQVTSCTSSDRLLNNSLCGGRISNTLCEPAALSHDDL